MPPSLQAVMNNCSSCGLFRPLFLEPDKTLVCFDCYSERNGSPPYRPMISERTIVEHPRTGMWGFPFSYPLVEDPRRVEARYLRAQRKKEERQARQKDPKP
jgi:hypothetical protein